MRLLPGIAFYAIGRVFYCIKKTEPNRFRFKLGYKDSNLEMTESESVALPFGDSPSIQQERLYKIFL